MASFKRCSVAVDGSSDGGDICGTATKYSSGYCALHELERLQSELRQAKQLIEELANGLNFYTHEKFRPGWEVSGIMMGHKFDISCAACNEQNRGGKAREVLSKNKDLIQRLTEEKL